jgi:hypothetical protein
VMVPHFAALKRCNQRLRVELIDLHELITDHMREVGNLPVPRFDGFRQPSAR